MASPKWSTSGSVETFELTMAVYHGSCWLLRFTFFSLSWIARIFGPRRCDDGRRRSRGGVPAQTPLVPGTPGYPPRCWLCSTHKAGQWVILPLHVVKKTLLVFGCCSNPVIVLTLFKPIRYNTEYSNIYIYINHMISYMHIPMIPPL